MVSRMHKKFHVKTIAWLLSFMLAGCFFGHSQAANGDLAATSAVLASASSWATNEHGKLRLIAESATVGDKAELQIGLHFKLEPGWHIYWRNPGDAGYPPKLDWSKSENVGLTNFYWPAPLRFSQSGIETIGYKDEVIFPITVTLKNPGAETLLSVNVDYLTCKEICIPYKHDLALRLAPGPFMPSAEADQIKYFKTLVPDNGKRDVITFSSAQITGTPEKPKLSVVAESGVAFEKPDLFVESKAPVFFTKPSVKFDNDNKRATLIVEPASQMPPNVDLSAETFTFTIIDGEKATEAKLRAVPMYEKFTQSLALILGFAILGGFILNLMPCVLPVLSLKLLKLTKHAGSERAKIRRGFLATTAGIVFSFWILAGILVAIKSSGMAIGWGFQFQQPVFLGVMIAILILFAANLWGIFEIPLPQWVARLGTIGAGRESLLQDFLTGALATLLATPCSAPFLGTAIGFALSQGAKEIFGIFTAIAIGLALPYILVALVPQIASRMPKPGHWMVTLRRILALLLVGTAVWLSMIVYNQTVAPVATVSAKDSLPWQEFAPEKIPGLLAEGKTVFVDVTADWCLTCKVNEKLVIESKTIRAALTQENVVLMRGDWTKPDDRIAAYLASFGRYGIPFNAVYTKQNPQGKPLPELLSESAVEKALGQ